MLKALILFVCFAPIVMGAEYGFLEGHNKVIVIMSMDSTAQKYNTEILEITSLSAIGPDGKQNGYDFIKSLPENLNGIKFTGCHSEKIDVNMGDATETYKYTLLDEEKRPVFSFVLSFNGGHKIIYAGNR